ncbi:MAG: TlpA family protein disulfide reductase [Rikenellaceae bacterium]|nr:TlpA family protein disulfide reductase [Rikenellaceae bacterium]
MKKTALIVVAAICLLGCSGGDRIIERPNTVVRNSNPLEIDKVIVNDTATVLYINAYFYPGWWIFVNEATYIQAGGVKYPLKGADGIVIHERHYMPESGEDGFILWFDPLPKGTVSFDLIESDCDDCFKIWGIDLAGNASYKNLLPADLKAFEVPQPGEQTPEPELRVGKTRVEVILHGSPESYFPEQKVLYVANFLTGERSEWPVESLGNGRYVFESEQYGTAYAALFIDEARAKMILSPGEQAEVHIDIPAFGATQSRYSTLPEVPYAAFRGVYAKLNNELNMPGNGYEHDIYAPAIDPATWRLTDQKYRELITSVCRRMEEDIDALDVSEQLRDVYRQDIKSQAVIAVTSKRMFFSNSEYMEKRRDDIQFQVRNATPEDYELLSGFDLNDLRWMYSGMFFNLPRQAVANVDTFTPGQADAIIELLSGGRDGLITDLSKSYRAFDAVESEAGASPAEWEGLSSASLPFYANAYKSMREKAMKTREKALKEGGFVINDTPQVADERILDAILADYKGRPVFVDFWATWCVPCLNAMKTIKPLKPEMADHGVVTLYISNSSSPESKWMSMLPEIGGIHYYLTDSQWSALTARYNITGIPQYMIFDRDGNKTYQTAGFPGVDKMREELEKVW